MWRFIILHICTINDNHMLYGSWEMECDTHNFLSFWTVFCPVTPLRTQKIKILKSEKRKKEKKTGDFIIYLMCTINENHVMHGSWDMEQDGQTIFVILDVFLPVYSPNNLKNQNFEKIKQTARDNIILHMCNRNENHVMYDSWDLEHDRLNYLLF